MFIVEAHGIVNWSDVELRNDCVWISSVFLQQNDYIAKIFNIYKAEINLYI